ncbi:hypothetical protein ANN_03123 [Periplaneta americana]|uniref:Uncharacterized protein n=1 Tax=Periplaneta americana TaxID=6978 RepID=A0ABQ8U213_PERAM|nr:hypothetical protein ANN_03123 [Periplaneta americana]
MSSGSSTESYPAFAHIGLRENPGKNLNQPRRDSITRPAKGRARVEGTRPAPVSTGGGRTSVAQRGKKRSSENKSLEAEISRVVVSGKCGLTNKYRTRGEESSVFGQQASQSCVAVKPT